MITQQVAGRDLNTKGHLAHFDHWDEDVALALAEEEGLTLNARHWGVINFLRDYYGAHEMPPTPRVVLKAVGHLISPHVPCTRRHLEFLFPDGGCKQACHIAGLPDYYCHGC
ncbi:TusE/DsrC/DsvC family sulfur relay protein [Candidatus Thiodictyon syntrophicum]|jgi:tRNA 2-thiouridine synthesizing protein E|uniref:Sulfurtransferase n=1 Tax=Candidatus Thiodictyon syntrophicum TaxID=1166950 RepID=A0A2K8U7Y2_9GAMM|nr:TusE/DsrC/DsvC family sulfur relay protein [Candidatus Thiodictyon syntrophicum]AUB81161.1 TusE/DsrC/DsvC family sulfurtransferase [Candidatus Thiodictyon syntrophicum]